MPALLGRSLFTVLLALVACVRGARVFEAEWFVVGGCVLGRGVVGMMAGRR
ncbi:MAG: hypothetical protein U9N46_04920 [Euryarchaeota archaeon]|nr:hypothetical protein [Euryarchaeota archaeon]